MEIFALCAITFELVKIKTCLAPQNNRLNLSFVKDTYVVGKKMTRNGRKSAICNSPFLCIRVYVARIEVHIYYIFKVFVCLTIFQLVVDLVQKQLC